MLFLFSFLSLLKFLGLRTHLEPFRGEKEKTLFDEPGIPELEKLYYDVFNYETGKFYKMSEQSKEQYNKDLEIEIIFRVILIFVEISVKNRLHKHSIADA